MFKTNAFMNKLSDLVLFVLPLLIASLILMGCDLTKNYAQTDRAANKSFQDFRDSLSPRISSEVDFSDWVNDENEIPEFGTYIADPSAGLKAMPLVSVSVNQTVPIRDILYELANQADYDIELDPRIVGSLIFTAREKPFDVVIQRISDMAGLRYKFDGDFLRIELDTPYVKTYKLDYLNFTRSADGDISNDIAVVTGEGADTGSSYSSTTETESDLWAEIEANLEQILGARLSGVLRTGQDPQVQSLNSPQRAPVEAALTNADGSIQPPEAILQISALPPVGQGDDFGGGGFGVAEDVEFTFSVNRQAGVLSVYADEKKHKEVKTFLDEVKRSVTAQVLIEAKVLEVELSDEFATGIDWEQFDVGNVIDNVDFNFGAGAFDTPLNPVNSGFTATLNAGGISAALSAVSRFGTVHALASPRITVMNNQPAVLNVADNLVFFEVDIETTRDEFGTDTDIDSSIRNVPEGVLINVLPSIDLDSRKISMAIRPTVTNVEDFVNDPAVAFTAAELRGDDPDAADAVANVESQVPVVQVQEMDSVLTMYSGQAVVMGGLMQDRVTATENGIPVLQEIPIIGRSLFKSHVDRIDKTELVIFIRATIIDDNHSSVHTTDKELYKLYSGDRRPLDL